MQQLSSLLVWFLVLACARSVNGNFVACSEGRWGARCENKCYCPEGPGCWCDDGITGSGHCYCWEGWAPAFSSDDRRAYISVGPHKSPSAGAAACNTWDEATLVPQFCWLEKGTRFQDLGVAPEPGNRPREINEFSVRIMLSGLPNPHLALWSERVGGMIGLGGARGYQEGSRFVSMLCGNELFPGAPEPLASLYAGHQFGSFRKQLGDGRAALLGEVSLATVKDNPSSGGEGGVGGAFHSGANVVSLQLKGAGRTPFSRQGDGRVPLHAAVREFLCSAYLSSWGIPTVRVLSVVRSATLTVVRDPQEEGSTVKVPAAVLLRVAPSFVRFGSFEALSARRDNRRLEALANFVVTHHFPHLSLSARKYDALLDETVRHCAHLVALWQAVGFVHGVLNTDNTGFGITLDLGPFGFMKTFTRDYVPNESDRDSLYAYRQQPAVMLRNVQVLSESLSPLLSGEYDRSGLADRYWRVVNSTVVNAVFLRLGLRAAVRPGLHDVAHPDLIAPETSQEDVLFVEEMFEVLEVAKVDFSLFFRFSWCLCAPPTQDHGSTCIAVAPLLDISGSCSSESARAHARVGSWRREYCRRAQAEADVDTLYSRVTFVNHAVAFNPDHVLLATQELVETDSRSSLSQLQDAYENPTHSIHSAHTLASSSHVDPLLHTVSCAFQ